MWPLIILHFKKTFNFYIISIRRNFYQNQLINECAIEKSQLQDPEWLKKDRSIYVICIVHLYLLKLLYNLYFNFYIIIKTNRTIYVGLLAFNISSGIPQPLKKLWNWKWMNE